MIESCTLGNNPRRLQICVYVELSEVEKAAALDWEDNKDISLPVNLHIYIKKTYC